MRMTAAIAKAISDVPARQAAKNHCNQTSMARAAPTSSSQAVAVSQGDRGLAEAELEVNGACDENFW